MLEILANIGRHEKPVRGVRMGKVKLTLFADDILIIMDLKCPKELMVKPNKIIRDFRKQQAI